MFETFWSPVRRRHRLEDNRRLAALPDQIALLGGETAFEGWAAERLGQVDRQPGLALLTTGG